jgi:hypothetical protein
MTSQITSPSVISRQQPERPCNHPSRVTRDRRRPRSREEVAVGTSLP